MNREHNSRISSKNSERLLKHLQNTPGVTFFAAPCIWHTCTPYGASGWHFNTQYVYLFGVIIFLQKYMRFPLTKHHQIMTVCYLLAATFHCLHATVSDQHGVNQDLCRYTSWWIKLSPYLVLLADGCLTVSGGDETGPGHLLNQEPSLSAHLWLVVDCKSLNSVQLYCHSLLMPFIHVQLNFCLSFWQMWIRYLAYCWELIECK